MRNITLSLLTHITLGAEMPGRMSLQGQEFKNTIEYLSDYLQQLKGKCPQELVPLKAILKQLSQYEKMLAKGDIDQLANQLVKKTQRLKRDQALFLTGGWLNFDPPGHAMIYQITKTGAGLRFSIFNAGTGLEHHEKFSTTDNEQYYPIKLYDIPEAYNRAALSSFFYYLILAQTPNHPERKTYPYDAKTLYQHIEKSLHFLQACPILAADQDFQHTTTVGQLAGTCAQQSIQQMIKVHFKDIARYRRFICEFKWFSLKHFIRTHPTPLSHASNELIILSIENLLKIIQEIELFQDDTGLMSIADDLLRMKEDISRAKTPAPSMRPTHKEPTRLYHYSPKPGWLLIDKPEKYLVKRQKNRLNLPLPFNIKQAILPQLERLIARCHALEQDDPLWIIQSIEKVIFTLPFPEKDSTETLCINALIDIQTVTNWEKLANKLDTLQPLYSEAYRKLLGPKQLPEFIITQCSFLALRDFYDTHLRNLTKRPPFTFVKTALNFYLEKFRDCPYLATNNPLFDKRLRSLFLFFSADKAIYLEELSKELPEDLYFATHYTNLLKGEPLLEHELETKYIKAFGKNQSEQHQLLRQFKISTLHYWFTHLNTHQALTINLSDGHAIKESKRRLNQSLQQQLKLEQFTVACFSQLAEGIVKQADSLGIKTHEQSSNLLKETRNEEFWFQLMVTIQTPASNAKIFSSQYVKETNHSHVSQQKYAIPDSIAKTILLTETPWTTSIKDDLKIRRLLEIRGRGKSTENAIQLKDWLEPKKQTLNQTIFLARDLAHLRVSKAYQVQLTLDYFKRMLNTLSDISLQRYVEANIFEPPLLLEGLQKNSESLIHELDAFIQAGLLYFSNQDQLTGQPALFFIHLRYKINQYIARYDPKIGIKRLEKDQLSLNAGIQNNRNPIILSGLHHYRFLTFIRCALQDYSSKDAEKEAFAQAYHSYFHLHAKTQVILYADNTSQFEMQQVEYQFQSWMEANHILTAMNDSQYRNLLAPILSDLDLKSIDVYDLSHYPSIVLKDTTLGTSYTVDAVSGKIYSPEGCYSPIPSDLIHNPLLIDLGIDNSKSCFISRDGNQIDLLGSNPIRVFRESNGLIIQKKWRVDAGEDWYELQALTIQQKNAFNLSQAEASLIKHWLPPVLADGTMGAWANERNLFLTQNGVPRYQVNQHNLLELIDASPRPERLVFCVESPTQQDELTQFEDPAFFTVAMRKNDRKVGVIDFYRYGIQLTIADKKVYLSNTDYQLQSKANSPFASNVACLTFESPTNRQCLVAVQPFYAAPIANQNPGEHFELIHDHSNTIAQYELHTIWTARKIEANAQPVWNYRNTETLITYTLVDGKPKPETPADALYLTYLYLATHQPLDAWAVLDALGKNSGLTGELAELTYLSWIFENLPTQFKTENREESENKKLNSPRYVACQLKALALYTRFLEQGKVARLPNAAENSQQQANEQYQTLCLKKLQAFDTHLLNTIHNTYSQWQRVRRNLAKTYTLTNSECRSLLNYANLTAPKNSQGLGSLSYEWLRLNLQQLKLYEKRLNAIEHSNATLPAKFAIPLQHLADEKNRVIRIMQKTTQLELVRFNSSISPLLGIRESLMEKKTLDQYKKLKSNVFKKEKHAREIKAMKQLTPRILEYDVINYFSDYLAIAINPQSPHHRQLKSFCLAYIKGFLGQDVRQHPNSVPILIEIIYRITHENLQYQEEMQRTREICLTPHSKYTYPMEWLVETVGQLPSAPIEIYQAKDVLETILASTEEIWQALDHHVTLPVLIAPPTAREPSKLTIEDVIEKVCAILTAPSKTSLEQFYSESLRIEANYEQKLNQLLQALPTKANAPQLMLAEKQAGEAQYQDVVWMQSLAERCLVNPAIHDALEQQTRDFLRQLTNTLDIQWKNALAIADRQSPDHHYAAQRRLQIAALQQTKPSKQNLLTTYLRSDKASYLEMNDFSPDEIEALHAKIHACILLEIELQRLVRLSESLAFAKKNPIPSSYHAIATVLTSKNLKEAQEPALMLFQYLDN